MSTQGIDIIQTTERILFRVSLKDQFGNKIVAGPAPELRIYRLEDDGTLDTFDWDSPFDFNEAAATPANDEQTMTHQQRADHTGAAQDTGIWTVVLTDLDNFTVGQVYIAQLTEATASPESQEREFQFGIAAHADLGPTQAQLDRNMDHINHLRGFHTHQGDTYYVGPATGNDSTGDGTRALPYATIDAAITDLVTSGNHDTIIVLADDSPGVTTHSTAAAIECDKRYFSILGPGRDLIVTRSNNGNTFEITADGVEISGFQIGTNNAGSGDGVNIMAADFHRIHNCWFLDTQGDGIHCERGSNCQFHDNHFEGTGVTGGGQGIHVTGSGGAGNADDNVIHHNHFADTDGTAILIDGGTTDDTQIHHNEIHDAGGWGIDITASSDKALVHSNFLGNNSSGDIRDNGSTSVIKNNDSWSTPVQTTTIATLASQTSFTLAGGSSDDDAYEGLTILVVNEADSVQVAHSLISAYTGSTKTVTLPVDPGVFTMAVGDKVTISATATAPGVADRVLTGATHNVSNSLGRRIRELDEQVGYEAGSIWLDTVNGTVGQVVGENGTVNNPSKNITDTVALAVATGRVRIRVASGSTIPLVANLEGYEIHNSNWSLQLEGFSISGTCVSGALVTGIGTGANRPQFIDCQFGAVTLPPSIVKSCGIGDSSGTFTFGSAGQYVLDFCYSVVPGSGTPVLVATGHGSATGINNRGWLGGANYTLDSDVTLSHEVLAGGGTTITTGGADVEIRGTTRSVTLVLSNAGTIQFAGITGPITISGTATSTVNLYGISASLADTSSGTTITDETLSSSGIAVASDGLDAVLVDGVAMPTAFQYIAAATAGKVSGAGTGTEVFVGIDGSTDRISATVDASGNRTAISLDP